ncbi:hypothetical protein D3273_06280 [Lichenibacterium minor]|jgi:hypothetical protein|uniref:Anti-sigma factor NepR domain-containing protein n=1 Tax=Lichenibacterium minor TaxID=2316528 RepID=A0A4V1RUX7_9HYPH|nr:NepR family anti-sigma factor [Lichenibacterium minor]RYC32694.1 hypothetical protein D3273_06280 [Lichenibacterium minor]
MNPEEENERAMPSKQDTSGSADAGGETSGSEDAARPGVTDVQAYIGRQLRAVYDDVVKQPIPDRFLALMKQLEEGAGQG